MAEQIIKAKVKHKIETSADWEKSAYVPLEGEIVAYSDTNKLKVGDGKTTVKALPFLADDDTTYGIATGTVPGLVKSGTGITVDASGNVSVNDNSHNHTITAEAADDDIVVLSGTSGTNKVTYKATHAKKGPASVYTSGNTTTSISGSGGSGTIKVPQITVDTYGHVTAATDENVTITLPAIDGEMSTTSTNPVQNKIVNSAISAKYTKPSSGIPKTDLASDVQASLGKADSALQSSLKGAKNGVASLDANGLVPTSQLPSYVDDVLEYNGKSNFPTSGETGKIYVDTSTNLTYRWSGSAYVEISPSLALGETSSTAYAGNKGKEVADKVTKIENGTTIVGKATSDSKGQNIADTYIKGLSVSGRTITYTKGDGDTGTITTQDTDTNTAHTHAAGTGLSVSGTGGTSGATTYSLKQASASEIGGVKVSSVNSSAVTVNTETATAGRYYPVELNSDGKAIVNVPWTDNNTDTKNTAGATDTSSKLFLVGATSQAANPQTYSHDTVYVGTDGCLYSGGKKVLTDHQSLSNYVTLDGAQTIKGAKTFSAENSFTGETKFTNAQYAPTFTDIANSVGKSSCFTRGALMQTITGQIIAPNTAVTDATHAYNTEVGKIKFQRITGTSSGQPTLEDMASIDSTGIKEGSKYLSEKYTDTSVMPNNSGEIKTKYRCSQKGYTSGATWYYKLCTLPVNNDGNYASVIISGRIGGWTSSNMSYINALVWNRDTPSISLIDIAGAATAMSSIWGAGDLVLYVNSTNTATLYVKCTGYFTFDLDIELFQSSAELTYDGTYVTSVSGTLSAQASTTTRRVEVVNGKLLVSGKALDTLSNGTSTAGLIKTSSTVTSNSGYTACPVINGVPYYKDTDQNVKNTLNTTTKAYITGTQTASTNTGGLIFDTGVYLGTTAGSLYATTFYGTSDRRLKENLTQPKFGDVCSLPIYKFDFIDGAKNQIGCMAQDLQQICPEIVNEDENGYLSIQENKIVYLLLDELKKMKVEMKAMAEELDALKRGE